MARKKVEKAHWTPDAKLRPLTGHEDDDDQHLRQERVTLTLDDAGLRKMQHEIVAVREALAPLKDQADAIKRQMKEKQDREKSLLEAMVSGTLTQRRQVYAYANDAEQTVQLYDPADKAFIATRSLAHHERQMEFDYGPTKVRDFDPEAPACPSTGWHDALKRDESRDEDGQQAWVCEEGCGVLMVNTESGEGLFYESDESDDDDQDSDHDAEDEGNA